MGVVAETALPISLAERQVHTGRKVMLNVELNDRCAFTSSCGDNCILNQLGSGLHREMDDGLHHAFARESVKVSSSVENMALVGKEPCETPHRLEKLVRSYHAADPAHRPLRFGMITAGHKLAAQLPLLKKYPLHWLLVSLDTEDSGLRNQRQVASSFEVALEAKAVGATGQIGVNSLMQRRNLAALVVLGERVLGAPTADQWGLSPMLQTHLGVTREVMSCREVEELVNRLATYFGETGKQVIINLPTGMYRTMLGIPENQILSTDFWRHEHQLTGTCFTLAAMNEDPGYFLRLRYHGAMMSLREFHTPGQRDGCYGNYGEGNLEKALVEMELQRNSTKVGMNL